MLVFNILHELLRSTHTTSPRESLTGLIFQCFRSVPASALQGLLQQVLQRRHLTYMSRIVVPAHLRAILGRAEITRSLRTQDHKEALRRLRVWEGHIERLLSIVSRQGARMTRQELDHLVRRYLDQRLEQIEDTLALDWSEAGLDQYRWDLNDRAHEISAALSFADPDPALGLARQMAPGASEDTLRKLSRRLMEVQLEAVKAELAALNGEPLRMPALYGAPPHTSAQDTAEAPPQAAPSLLLSEVADIYSAERVAERNWNPKTEFQNRTILALLAELMGNPPIKSIDKEAIRAVGTDIVNLPSNMTKRFSGVAPRDVLARLEGDSTTPRLEPRSVNKYRQLLRSLFKWALEHEYVAVNPATVLRDVKEPPPREGREDFTDEDLVTYFARLPQEQEPLPFLYWIPRIMAYTGMRLGEASQLRKQDLREAMGLRVLDLNTEDGKTLKNAASRRQVPIHPRLVELGLLEFIDGSPEGFLWPERFRTTDNRKRQDSDRLSKLLGRFLRRSGVTDEKKTGAHSFRHTVSTRLKDASVPEYQIADLIGHEDDSMTTGRYGKGTNVKRLLEVASLLKLPI